ncbi:hypothetical protein K4A83_14600 [Spirulina subsalsa FACHB-351]|uniref:Plastid lipid-associated protein/fibrillin conserved domain-containing protein n=1 Tax=Spirulina subsalsa FACHB-351 TaxID=234711 RepID=A0ABT3L8S3_9CYAN|nr:hypothetical protein [Spirulina subsalsa]MCW6037494.1 hypothetical protein [Spirulina subsalsa FACHB-351]
MSNYSEIIEMAALSLAEGKSKPPSSEVLREALLAAEKAAQKNPTAPGFEALMGDWQLGWITGTQRSRQQAGGLLGAGRYLPRFLGIRIRYQPRPEGDSKDSNAGERGQVENQVTVLGLTLTVSGPVAWQKGGHTPGKKRANRLLAFDFTRLQAQLYGMTLFDGLVRGGAQREAVFDETAIAQQAFFNYFYLSPKAIAARGRGGGLALWYRVY